MDKLKGLGFSPKHKKLQKARSTSFDLGNEVSHHHHHHSEEQHSHHPGSNGYLDGAGGEFVVGNEGGNAGGLFEEAMKGDDIMAILADKSAPVPTRERKQSFSRSISLKVREKIKKSERDGVKDEGSEEEEDGEHLRGHQVPQRQQLQQIGKGRSQLKTSMTSPTSSSTNLAAAATSSSSLTSPTTSSKEERKKEKEREKESEQAKKKDKKRRSSIVQIPSSSSPLQPFKRRGFRDAFSVTKSRSHSNLYTKTKEFEDSAAGRASPPKSSSYLRREYLSAEEDEGVGAEDPATSPGGSGGSPGEGRLNGSSSRGSLFSSDEDEDAGMDDVLGLMEFMRSPPPPRKTPMSLSLLHLKNSCPCKLARKEYKWKDLGIP